MHYYNYHRILSYNCPVNCLFGERGCGKSYGAKKYVIQQYNKNRSQFLYLRRYDNEIKEIFEKPPISESVASKTWIFQPQPEQHLVEHIPHS